MDIQPIELKGRIRYFINNNRNSSVAWFDTLAEASLVLRFLTGAAVRPKEQLQALEAIRAYDGRLEELYARKSKNGRK